MKKTGKFILKKKSITSNSDLDFITDIENEQYILSCVLKFDNVNKIFFDTLYSDDFLIINHKAIAWCILYTIEKKQQLTPEILQINFKDYPGSKKATGLKYIYDLINSQEKEPTLENYKIHLNKIKTDKVKHEIYNKNIIPILSDIQNPQVNLDNIINNIDSIKTHIDKSNIDNKSVIYTMSDLQKEHRNVINERLKGGGFRTTGYRALDEILTEGLAGKKLSIVAGRTGMCKSAFVDNVLIRLGSKKIQCAVFSLEMDRTGTNDRFISISTEIDIKKIIKDRRELTEEEISAEKKCMFILSRLPIYVYDKAAPSLFELRKQITYLKNNYDVKVVFIDLFSKLSISKDIRNKSTADQLTAHLNEIQTMAKDLDIHISLVVQIGRKAEQRKNKRPTLVDLKDSGSYEEAADLVLLLYRESYYLKGDDKKEYFNKTRNKDIVEIEIAKQRQGETTTVKMQFKGKCTKIIKLR